MDFETDPHDWYPSETSKIHLDFSDLSFKKDSILYAIQTYKVLILNSSTFSSKTYYIPQILISSGFVENGWHIGLLFSSRNSAVSKSKLILQLFGANTVGLSLDWCENIVNNSLIKILTPESLLTDFKRSPLLDSSTTGYSAIFIDNFSSTDLKLQLCLSLLHKVAKTRPSFRLIIGTVYNESVSELLRFFNGEDSTDEFRGFSPLNLPLANVLHLEEISGENIIIKHLPVTPDDAVERSMLFLEQLHETSGPGNILIFLPSFMDCINYSTELSEKKIPNLVIVAGGNVTISSNELKRYVFFASSVCQLDRSYRNIKYVIDCGLTQRIEFDIQKQWTYYKCSRITKKEADVRAAIAGFYPNGRGIVYRMFPPNCFNEEIDQGMIQQFHKISLPLLALGIKDFKAFNFYYKPSLPLLSYHLLQLNYYGILSNDGELTPTIGEPILHFFGLPLCLARFLIASFENGVTEDALSIIVMMTLDMKFDFGSSRVREGDLLSLHNYYQRFIHFDSPELKQKIQYVKRLKFLLRTKCEELGKVCHTKQTEKLIKAIVEGFFPNAAVFNIQRQAYIHLVTNEILYIHPNSVLKDLDMRLHVHYVVFGSIEYTDKPYMKHITVVDDPSLLVEVAPKLYTGILGSLPSAHRQKPIHILDESVLPSSLVKLAHTTNYYTMKRK